MSFKESTEGYVTSLDGTRIGFLSRGKGPGLVLVQGAMATAYSFDELAQSLAQSFTVYTPDRRGRGMSPKPYDSVHNIARDVEDLDALLKETGSTKVFGLSSGAVITLEAARTLPQIDKASVYEPPFRPDGVSHGGILRLNSEIERGDLASALVSALLTSETAPAPLRTLPRPAARLLARIVLGLDSLKRGPSPKLRDLLPGVRYDFNVVSSLDGKIETFSSVDKPVLLLSGAKSPAYLRHSIRQLERVLPDARHIEFDGLGHSGSWNRSQGGRPDLVADAMREFFS